MLIDISENDIYELLLIYVNKKNNDKIEYYLKCVDIYKYPDLFVILGNYYQFIDNVDRALYYYYEGLKTIDKNNILVCLFKYYIKLNNLNECKKLIIKYNSNDFYDTLLKKSDIYEVDDIIKILNLNETKETCLRILSLSYQYSKWSKYIEYLLILSKKYNMNNYKEIFNSYLKSIFSKNLYNNNINVISNILFAKKCYSCDEHIYIFKLECGHYICPKCCFEKIDYKTFEIICTCHYKSIKIYNMMITYLMNLNK